MIGGKKVQDLIDEYKLKATKAKEDSDKKTAELLAKSKKIAELQAAMKREETLLKKAVTDSTSFKRQLTSVKTSQEQRLLKKFKQFTGGSKLGKLN